jgi:hypothetical protein
MIEFPLLKATFLIEVTHKLAKLSSKKIIQEKENKLDDRRHPLPKSLFPNQIYHASVNSHVDEHRIKDLFHSINIPQLEMYQ